MTDPQSTQAAPPHTPPSTPAATTPPSSTTPAAPQEEGVAALHNGEIDPGDTQETGKPFLARCSCQTEGRFKTQDQAEKWLKSHLVHVGGDPKNITVKEKKDGSQSQGGPGSSGSQQVQEGHAAQGVGSGSQSKEQAPGVRDRQSAGAGEAVKKT